MGKQKATKEETTKPSGGKGKGYIAGTNLPAMQMRQLRNGEFALLERRKTVADRYLNGKAQWEISQELNVDQRVVGADLDFIRKTWLESIVHDFDRRKSEEVAKIDYIERKMWEAYEKSCGKEVVRTKEVTEVGDSVVNKNKTQKKQLIGDTRYIDKVQWCIDIRCKIFGIIKDEKRESINNTTINIAWDNIPDTGGKGIEDMIALIESQEPAPIELKPTDPVDETI